MRSRESLREDDRRKDEFLAMLAHELRNPLAPITSAVAVLQRAPEDRARVRSMTEMIGNAELSVSADRKRLVQVFANILGNAAKYTPAGGRIAVEARRGDGDIRVLIEDNGQGMRPELIERVFELFAQGERTPDRHQGGLGVGLALVKRILELHGGQVAAFSGGPGQGCAFEVVLPAATSAAFTESHDGHPVVSSAPPLRVLVVDDNQGAANALALFSKIWNTKCKWNRRRRGRLQRPSSSFLMCACSTLGCRTRTDESSAAAYGYCLVWRRPPWPL